MNKHISNIIDQITKTREKHERYSEEYKEAQKECTEIKLKMDLEEDRLKDYIQILEQLALGNMEIVQVEGEDYTFKYIK